MHFFLWVGRGASCRIVPRVRIGSTMVHVLSRLRRYQKDPKVNLRNIYGPCLEHVLSIKGKQMEHRWNINGTPIANLWQMYGNLWNMEIYGNTLEHLWNIYGL